MNAAPPKIAATNKRFAGVVVAATVLGIAAVVFFFDPATHKIYPACQFHRLTGLNCPGCGMTRAFYTLLHINFSVALRNNALFVFAVMGLAIRGAWFGVKIFRGQTTGEYFPVKWLWPLLAVALMFAVLRNLPGFAFLSP